MIHGKLGLDDLRAQVENGALETVVVGFSDHFGRLLGKRFEAGYFCETVATGGTHACDYLLTTDMEMEPVAGYSFANWERGYGDVHLVPDLNSLRVASWLNRSAIVICDVSSDKTHALVPQAPRTILKRQLERAESLGYSVQAATELEYYLFDTSYRLAAEAGYTGLEPAGWYLEDYHLLQGARTEDFTALARRHLCSSGIPVESSKGEWGLGQHEINLRYAGALETADRHTLFKQCLKELADAQGKSLTFMAKPFSGRAGSSCHVHLSLWQDEKNAFGTTETDTFRHFLGGWLGHAPEVMAFYAPTVNAYKRYEDQSWAPTRLAWSLDNRTAGFRVVGQARSLRLECRIPGADCNPYLALAAAIASGLDGLERGFEPPARFDGDVYAAADLPHVPRSLREATELFAGSDFAKAAFGDDVIAHYTHFFRTEQAAFDAFVTDWERQRYFERI